MPIICENVANKLISSVLPGDTYKEYECCVCVCVCVYVCVCVHELSNLCT